MKILMWLATNLLFAIVLYFGVIQEVQGAINLVLFYIWFIFTLGWFGLTDDGIESVRKNGLSPIPPWINGIYRGAVLALLIWYGWFWSAIAWAISTLLLSMVQTRAKKESKEES